MTATIVERVAVGAAWLDTEKPGWVDRIDLEKLDLVDPDYCILGQEYGSYFGAPLSLAGRLDFGFAADSESYPSPEWDKLTSEWYRYITSHRGAHMSFEIYEYAISFADAQPIRVTAT